MADYTITELSKKMREIDFAMLFTKSEGGEMAGRPMTITAKSSIKATASSSHMTRRGRCRISSTSPRLACPTRDRKA